MAKRLVKICLVVVAVLFFFENSEAQKTDADSILVTGFVIETGDTVIMVLLDEAVIIDKLPRKYARIRKDWDRLRYNVYKVYPYAVTAAEVLKDVDVNLEKIGDNKEARKKYLKSIERELNKRFKGELQDFTITQGQILVRLIDRQTGKNCFSIIQELKGGFSAVVWQSVALLFSNNLKREYDPQDRDKDIEKIVQEIETRNYYQSMYRQK